MRQQKKRNCNEILKKECGIQSQGYIKTSKDEKRKTEL